MEGPRNHSESQEDRDRATPSKVWSCKIGWVADAHLPDGADVPMRAAVREAYYRLTGTWPQFILSGWGGQLNAVEEGEVRMSIEDRS